MDRRKRSSARHILISVDESEGCERALQWTLDQLYRPGEASALFTWKSFTSRISFSEHLLCIAKGASYHFSLLNADGFN